MAAISVNDGGTWRTPYQISVNDGGTWRTIQQIYVNDGGTWRTVFQYLLLDTTITEGQGGVGNNYYGYSDPSIFNFGSIGSASIQGGYTLRQIYADAATSSLVLSIDGFSSDPGQSFFSSIDLAGTNKTSASATYAYGSGTATWTWASSFLMDGVGTSTLVITP